MTLSPPPARLANSISVAHCSPGSRRSARTSAIRVVVDHVGEPVGAEQHAIAVHQLKPLDLDQRMRAGRADGVGQDVAQVLRAALDGRRPVRVGEVPLDGVIARQLRQLPSRNR